MKRRTVPNMISRRFRRKLRRSKDPFLLWLRCKRPVVYARLVRLWQLHFYDRICSITPHDTPLFSTAPRITINDIRKQWETDEYPQTYAWYVDRAE